MTANLLQALGGLGLFLFGMSVMTDGLRGLAGNLLHRVLARFTHSPLSGAVTGSVVTTLLQSSSATTVAAVGFVGAFLLLPFYVAALAQWLPAALDRHAEIALVGFHSLFNLLGVLVVLPFAGAFASMMCRLVPERSEMPEYGLDRRLLSEPSIALDTAIHHVMQQVVETLKLLQYLRHRPDALRSERIDPLQHRLAQVRSYLDEIHLSPEQQRDWHRLNASIHLLDHLERLLARCEEEPERIHTLVRVTALHQLPTNLSELVLQLEQLLEDAQWQRAAELASAFSDRMDAQAEMLRSNIAAQIAAGELGMPEGTEQLEAVRWARRVSLHLARILRHTQATR